jgi:uncharacterized protein YdhG (YjbR/CyaY superfamily)
LSRATQHDSKEDRARVRAYMAGLPPASRKRMKEMRDLIRATAPAAVESFSYRIPGFRLDGRQLVWYAAFQLHTSLFPMTSAIRRSLAAELKGYETSKGTVRFPLDRPLPAGLVRKLVRARLAEARAARRT